MLLRLNSPAQIATGRALFAKGYHGPPDDRPKPGSRYTYEQCRMWGIS